MKRTLRFGLPLAAALVASAVVAALALGGNPGSPPGQATVGQLVINGKTIPVFSFSAGVSNPTTIGTGGGGIAAGRPSISSVNVMTALDANSPDLHAASALGTKFPTAVVSGTWVVGGVSTTFKYELENVIIESIQVSGGSGAPAQSMSLAFEKIKWTFTDANGTVTRGWDLTTNTPNP